MDTLRKLMLLVGAAMLALTLTVGPAFADVDEAEEAPVVEDDAEEAPATQQEDDDGRIALADSPRDRVGLILLGSLFAAAGFGFLTMRRQLKGEHPQASGEFRWR
jgi:hypothetical protein